MGPYEGRNAPPQVRAAVQELQRNLDVRQIPLQVIPGADVRIDHRLEALFDSDAVSSIADAKRYLLLELPHETYIELRHLIAKFSQSNRTLIITHPERHSVLRRKSDLMAPWLDEGGILQITGGSLFGTFGRTSEEAAWEWLQRGLVHLVASDAHGAVSRPPTMSDAIDEISDRLGEKIAGRVCVENPLRVLRGEPLLSCDEVL
jgi:protein-tyrosine phosphatase